jgi:hypothetical protein
MFPMDYSAPRINSYLQIKVFGSASSVGASGYPNQLKDPISTVWP